MAKLNELSQRVKELLKERNQGVKIDIGCGANKQGSDWIGIDIRKLPGVDVVQDLEKCPWPLPSECASLAVASHVLEHINPANGIFLRFMDEVWRIMKPEGIFLISLPYAGSHGYWQDPTHCNGCNETTWEYFDPLAPTGLWHIYKPKPWKIVPGKLFWSANGNMELALEKRALDKSYQ